MNQTHVFIAGGYARAYYIKNLKAENTENISEDTEKFSEDIGGGIVLNKAWIYDGNDWNPLPNMFEPRDRPACTTINMPNGEASD